MGSGGMLSAPEAKVIEDKEAVAVACIAVACMAFIRRELFCRLLGTLDSVSFRLVEASGIPSTPCGTMSSCFFPESSVSDGSTIGQTNPVRGA